MGFFFFFLNAERGIIDGKGFSKMFKVRHVKKKGLRVTGLKE